MNKYIKTALPLAIGVLISTILQFTSNWWGFWVIFPWVGFSISVGTVLRQELKGRNRLIGRKITNLMILPCLLFFVPIVNNENLQLEGVFLITLVGIFNKGFIHYAIAKIFGPLIWRRGYCGYACWTAAVLDWLPIKKSKARVPDSYRNIRYISLLISVALPLFLVFAMSYNPKMNYINKDEIKWMFLSNGIYYLISIPLAFILSDKRAFCKHVCPVALVMKPSAKFGLIKIKPNLESSCTSCGACNKVCPMGVDVMGYMSKNLNISDSECILCSDCSIVCPTKKIV